MAQISKGDSFLNGQQVTGSRLNQLVDSATLLAGAITDQPTIGINPVTGVSFTASDGKTATVTSSSHNLSTGDILDVTASVSEFSGRQTITVTSSSTFTFTIPYPTSVVSSGTLNYQKANLVAGGDSLFLYDTSASELRQATISQLLNSGIDASVSSLNIENVISSVINAKTNRDINVTPNDNISVSGKSFVSIDGITATVTSTGHGLESNMLIDATASNAVYSGQHIITVISDNTFSFVISQTTPVAASGTLSYTKKGSVKVIGNQHISNKLTVAGTTTLGATSATSLTIGGKTPMTTQDNLMKVYVKSGFTTGITAGGSTESTIYTLPALGTIPSDETWTYEFYVMLTAGYMYDATRPVSDLPELLIYNGSTLVTSFQGSTGVYGEISSTFIHSLVGVSSATYSLRYKSVGALREDPRYLIRLTKVKTSTLSDASSCI